MNDFQFWYNVVLGIFGTGFIGSLVLFFLKRRQYFADVNQIEAETTKIHADTDKTGAEVFLTEATAAESIQRAATGLMSSFQIRLEDMSEEIKDLQVDISKKDLRIAALEEQIEHARDDADQAIDELQIRRAEDLERDQIFWLQANYIRSTHAWMKEAKTEINRLGGSMRPVPAIDSRIAPETSQ